MPQRFFFTFSLHTTRNKVAFLQRATLTKWRVKVSQLVRFSKDGNSAIRRFTIINVNAQRRCTYCNAAPARVYAYVPEFFPYRDCVNSLAYVKERYCNLTCRSKHEQFIKAAEQWQALGASVDADSVPASSKTDSRKALMFQVAAIFTITLAFLLAA
jgi:hypothetical protein